MKLDSVLDSYNKEIRGINELYVDKIKNEFGDYLVAGDCFYRGESHRQLLIVKEIDIRISGFSNDIDIEVVYAKIYKSGKVSISNFRFGPEYFHEIYKPTESELDVFFGRNKPPKSYSDRYLYILRNELGRVKIGHASDVDRRIKELKMQSGSEIECLNLIPKAAEFESKLHDYFKGKRILGEWFDLTPIDIILLKELDKPKLEQMFYGGKLI